MQEEVQILYKIDNDLVEQLILISIDIIYQQRILSNSYQWHFINVGVIFMFNYPIRSSLKAFIAWKKTKIVLIRQFI